MAPHNHRHSESARHTGPEKSSSNTKKLHKDWRVWLVVGLMLTAMAIYVLTLDDSVIWVGETVK